MEAILPSILLESFLMAPILITLLLMIEIGFPHSFALYTYSYKNLCACVFSTTHDRDKSEVLSRVRHFLLEYYITCGVKVRAYNPLEEVEMPESLCCEFS